MADIPILSSIADVGADRAAWLVDVWGVIHNGVQPFASSVAACAQFRTQGGRIILVTNAPRPSASVVQQLDRIGVPRDTYDAIVTSGDVTRGLIQAFADAGKKVHRIGPDRDTPLFDGLDVAFATSIEAEIVVCTGLDNDETETPDDYQRVLDRLLRRNAVMVCANPDLKVERGNTIVFCAGAIAAKYADMGGEVVYAGKPHGPIYELAEGIVTDLVGAAVSRERLLAIGDGINTDIRGAADAGIASVYIASGIHLAPDAMTPEALMSAFGDHAQPPIAAMRTLAW